ncbi:DUF4031 domain-containing protein [Garicola koreensis]|uniref:Putative metal-dependent HD superfamily phosphohydrolase n=1 Tax=Garicola koreensis TaxID=1262554 RepID=A0A7W5TRV4_9MICC|nr:putative metal-dependent HD superfamily phosphohydrolase [Garicola koreensis]
MSLYIDPPVWPAHGTVFSHLVSDASLEELHTFAQQAGISGRAFDRDHYDVPEHRYRDLVQRGAAPISGGQLARILAASGMRVTTRERPEKVRKNLFAAWQRLGAAAPAAETAGWAETGQRLLDRWEEPHRSYHAPHHLAAVLRGVGIVERAGELPADLRLSVRLAGWYHDAVYAGEAGRDEEASAQLAQQDLDAVIPGHMVEEVGRLIRLTASHLPENDDAAGAALVDADLEILGRDPAVYRRYVAQVRADYSHVSDADFAHGRAQVLQRLLSVPSLFHTRTGYARWEAAARRNVEGELVQLQSGERPWRP